MTHLTTGRWRLHLTGRRESARPSAGSDQPVTTREASAIAPDPCSLLTTDEIDAATGLTFGDGAVNETVTQENQTACDWLAVSGLGIVQVLVLTVDVYDSSRDSASEIVGVVDVSVPGASRAYATDDGSIVGMDMGGTYLQVSFLSSDQPDVSAATLQLAAAAAGRLA
jgi:hypothetical protein